MPFFFRVFLLQMAEKSLVRGTKSGVLDAEAMVRGVLRAIEHLGLAQPASPSSVVLEELPEAAGALALSPPPTSPSATLMLRRPMGQSNRRLREDREVVSASRRARRERREAEATATLAREEIRAAERDALIARKRHEALHRADRATVSLAPAAPTRPAALPAAAQRPAAQPAPMEQQRHY